MNILYIVHFNAPMGGLHENVYSSALFMKKQCCNVYVMLKPGPLQKRLKMQTYKLFRQSLAREFLPLELV